MGVRILTTLNQVWRDHRKGVGPAAGPTQRVGPAADPTQRVGPAAGWRDCTHTRPADGECALGTAMLVSEATRSHAAGRARSYASHVGRLIEATRHALAGFGRRGVKPVQC
jgi:hypothetical protein